MTVRRVAIDQHGRFVSDLQQQGNVLLVKKTAEAKRAAELSDAQVSTIRDWETKAARFGGFDSFQVIYLELVAV